MQQPQAEPLHWDDHRTKLNLTLIFALVLFVFSLSTLDPGSLPLLLISLGVAAYSWLNTPKQYLIYKNALVIICGRPRVKSYPFENMAHLELLTLPIGNRVRVRMANGSRIMLLPKDAETFNVKLDEALEAFHGTDSDSAFNRNGGHNPGVNTPTIIDVEPNPETPEPEIEIVNEIPPDTRMGESSTEKDDVPY